MCPDFNGPIGAFMLPGMNLVTAITKAYPATVTTKTAHNYVSGTIVRLYVPETYGMFQANSLTGEITVLTSTTFTIPIDTRTFDAFVDPSPVYDPTADPQPVQALYAQVCAIGERNDMFTAAVKNTLE